MTKYNKWRFGKKPLPWVIFGSLMFQGCLLNWHEEAVISYCPYFQFGLSVLGTDFQHYRSLNWTVHFCIIRLVITTTIVESPRAFHFKQTMSRYLNATSSVAREHMLLCWAKTNCIFEIFIHTYSESSVTNRFAATFGAFHHPIPCLAVVTCIEPPESGRDTRRSTYLSQGS